MQTQHEGKSYVEYIDNLRTAFRVVAEKIPEVMQAAEDAKKRRGLEDPDLKIILMSDFRFNKLVDDYLEVEPKLCMFNPEEEYGWEG